MLNDEFNGWSLDQYKTEFGTNAIRMKAKNEIYV
jgi:hypothetical protein